MAWHLGADLHSVKAEMPTSLSFRSSSSPEIGPVLKSVHNRVEGILSLH
jgi:hypothetical protein